MIADLLKNADLYKTLPARIREGIEYLQKTDLSSLEVGRYELDGDRLFVLIQEYTPKTLDVAKMEAHRNYADIQYIIEGREQMGYMPVDAATETVPYNPEKDVVFFEGNGDLMTYEQGMFGIFFPQDGHMPGVGLEGCEKVKKAVVKIRL